MWFFESLLAPLLVSLVTAYLLTSHEIIKSKIQSKSEKATELLGEIQRLAIRYWSQSGQIPDVEFDIKGAIAVLRRYLVSLDPFSKENLSDIGSRLNRRVTGGQFETLNREPDCKVIDDLNQACNELFQALDGTCPPSIISRTKKWFGALEG